MERLLLWRIQKERTIKYVSLNAIPCFYNFNALKICKTNLIPGLLKFIHSNKGAPIPIKLFEVNDIVLKSNDNDVGAVNVRMLCATYSQKNGTGLEVL